VPCPTCFAKVDAPCYGSRKDSGKVSGYHVERVEVWVDTRARSRLVAEALRDSELGL
jgi:hypothetical protein